MLERIVILTFISGIKGTVVVVVFLFAEKSSNKCSRGKFNCRRGSGIVGTGTTFGNWVLCTFTLVSWWWRWFESETMCGCAYMDYFPLLG